MQNFHWQNEKQITIKLCGLSKLVSGHKTHNLVKIMSGKWENVVPNISMQIALLLQKYILI